MFSHIVKANGEEIEGEGGERLTLPRENVAVDLRYYCRTHGRKLGDMGKRKERKEAKCAR